MPAPADLISVAKASIIAWLNALLAASVLFGVKLTNEQIAAVMLVANLTLANIFMVYAIIERRSPVEANDGESAVDAP